MPNGEHVQDAETGQADEDGGGRCCEMGGERYATVPHEAEDQAEKRKQEAANVDSRFGRAALATLMWYISV